MQKTEITCDGCGADIVYRSINNLVLTSQDHNKPTYDFCGPACLDLWTDRRRYKDALRKESTERWIDEHGTRYANGKGCSYPSRAGDVIDKLNEQFDAAALEKFPLAKPKRTP